MLAAPPFAPPPMPFADDLQASPQRVADTIRFSGLWLAMLDGPLDPRELHEVALALPHEPEGLPLEAMIAALERPAESGLARDLPRVLRFLRAQRAPRRTESLLDFWIRVVAADGSISQAERHGLMLLSDLMAAPGTLLPDRFEALLELAWEPPADLSDPTWFEKLEAWAEGLAARRREEQRAVPVAADRDALRREALGVLGLKDPFSAIELKAAWRRGSRQWHPDRHVGRGSAAEAEATARFQALQAAYQRLADDPALFSTREEA